MNKKPENMGGRGHADGDLLGDPPGGGAGDDAGEARGPGRPKGAMNRKTRDLGRYLAATVKGYEDPALVLARAMSASIEDIRTEIHCSAADAKAMKLHAAKELMPYLHGKMPIREDDDEDRIPVLIVDTGRDQLTEQRVGRHGAGDQALRIGYADPSETAENSHSEGDDDEGSHG